MYLPIAAEAEAASRALAQLPAGAQDDRIGSPENVQNLPAQVEPSGEGEAHEERGAPLIPSIPDATKAAARWIRPLVPPFVARVIDNTTQPLRTARQVFEEVEEITFSLKRTRKVTIDSESSDTGDQPPRESATADTPSPTGRIHSSREGRGHSTHDTSSQRARPEVGRHEQQSSWPLPAGDVEGRSLGSAERDRKPELMERDGPRELRAPEGPRELPPPK